MPGSLALVLLGALLHVLAGAAALAFRRFKGASLASGAASVVGAMLAVAGALFVLLGSSIASWAWGASPALRLDSLSALLICAVSISAAAASLYRIGSTGTGEPDRAGAWTGVFLAAMLVVLVADDAFTLVAGLELAGLAACFQILLTGRREAVGAAGRFALTSFAGSVLVAIALLLLAREAQSVSFAAWRTTDLSGPVAMTAFALALVGFLAKAGLIPMHSWLLREASVAPAHVSALLSGAWAKLGIYGIIRLGLDLLHPPAAWCGWVVLALGAGSAVLGAMYSCTERDLKRLLAYSTSENIGIILMGVGVSLVGKAHGQPTLAMLGLLGALYHALNHALFKSLMFLCAGSVVAQVGTHELDRMGGLARTMPWTAGACFVGVMGITALPPLNGFVSEWFTYQALFRAALEGDTAGRLLAPLAMVLLGLTGGLVVMGFVKAFGIAFLGLPRSSAASEAREVAPTMQYAQAFLAVGCVFFGLGAPWVAPVVQTAAASVAGSAPAVAEGLAIFPADPAIGVISPALIAVLLGGLLAVPVLLAALHAAERPPRKISQEIWATGYAPEASMHVSSFGFTEPIRVMFRLAFALRGRPRPRAALRPALAGAPRAAAAPTGVGAGLALAEPTPGGESSSAPEAGPTSRLLAVAVLAGSLGLIALFWIVGTALSSAGGR